MDTIKKKRGHGTNYQYPYMFPSIFRDILYWEVYNMADFHILVQCGFRVIQKVYLLIYTGHIMMPKLFHFSTYILNGKAGKAKR